MSIKHLSKVNKTLYFVYCSYIVYIFSDFRLTQYDRKFLLIFFWICIWKCIKLNARRKWRRERSNGVFNGIKNVNSQFQLLINFRCWVFVAFDRTTRLIFVYKKFLGIDAVYGFEQGVETLSNILLRIYFL